MGDGSPLGVLYQSLIVVEQLYIGVILTFGTWYINNRSSLVIPISFTYDTRYLVMLDVNRIQYTFLVIIPLLSHIRVYIYSVVSGSGGDFLSDILW